MRVEVSRTGDASVDLAWSRYADLDQWRTWAPQIWRVRAESRTLAPGLTGQVYGAPGVIAFTVEHVSEEHHSWSWTVRPPLVSPRLLSIRMEHHVWAEGDGSGTSLVMHGPAALVAPYGPLAGHALQRLVTA